MNIIYKLLEVTNKVNIPEFPSHIKVTNHVINRYIKNCNFGQDTKERAKFNILKMYTFSKHVYTYKNGNKIYRFWDMCLIVKDDTVIDIYRDKHNELVVVEDKLSYNAFKNKYGSKVK